MPSRMVITKDEVSKVVAGINALVGKQVLVGIPESKAGRGDSGAMNNATIGFLMENGIPSRNVPARPHLIPGVKKSEASSVAQLRKAADATLSGKPDEAMRYLYNAGALAMLAVRDLIDTNIPPPLSPATIYARKYARRTKSRRENEEVYADLIEAGVMPGAAQAETDIIALVNTGRYRNSITYVIRTSRGK